MEDTIYGENTMIGFHFCSRPRCCETSQFILMIMWLQSEWLNMQCFYFAQGYYEYECTTNNKY